jgi:hypothetical protein
MKPEEDDDRNLSDFIVDDPLEQNNHNDESVEKIRTMCHKIFRRNPA